MADRISIGDNSRDETGTRAVSLHSGGLTNGIEMAELFFKCISCVLLFGRIIDGENDMFKCMFEGLVLQQVMCKPGSHIFSAVPENATAPGAEYQRGLLIGNSH